MQWFRNRIRLHADLPSGDSLRGYAVALLAIGLATAVLSQFRGRLGLLNIGLLFLLLVVLIAARWGWGPGLFSSVVANLAFNFFFVPPLYEFTVQEPANVLALLVFLGVAALTSFLLARAQTGEAQARQREQETSILYDLSRLIIAEVNLSATLASICDRVRDTFNTASCAVLLPTAGGLAAVAWSGERDPGLDTADERQAAQRSIRESRVVALGTRPGGPRRRVVGLTGRAQPVVYLPLRVGGATTGVLRVRGRIQAQVFTEDELRLLQAFADEAALAVDRDRLLREAARVEALHEADQLKSALLSAVSHDLRTPLTTILASASSLLQADVQWDDATRRQFLTQIEDQALHLTRVVSNLLDLSRIEGGALRPDRDWYEVRDVVEDAIAAVGGADGTHHIVLDAAPDTGNALFDQVQVGQVMQNLLENAIKFSPKGSEIRVHLQRLDGAVEIAVEDQGPGIPPRERERVFDKFYRVAGTAGRVRGTGIGLAISKGLVEANGGHIRVEEAPGGGARFVVTVPAPQEASTPAR